MIFFRQDRWHKIPRGGQLATPSPQPINLIFSFLNPKINNFKQNNTYLVMKLVFNYVCCLNQLKFHKFSHKNYQNILKTDRVMTKYVFHVFVSAILRTPQPESQKMETPSQFPSDLDNFGTIVIRKSFCTFQGCPF